MKAMERWAAVLLGLGGGAWALASVTGADPVTLLGTGGLVTGLYWFLAAAYGVLGLSAIVQSAGIRRRRGVPTSVWR